MPGLGRGVGPRENVCRCDHGYDDNAAVVIDQEGNPKGTRLFGAIARELRQFHFTKIVSLAPEVL